MKIYHVLVRHSDGRYAKHLIKAETAADAHAMAELKFKRGDDDEIEVTEVRPFTIPPKP